MEVLQISLVAARVNAGLTQEDVRSLNAKFSLIEEFNLMGAGYWTIMQWFRPNWELISYRFKILKKL